MKNEHPIPTPSESNQNNSSTKENREGIKISNSYGIVLFHLIPVAMIWTGATWFDWMLCAILYFVRMFFVTGVYHRYFSHRTYKTSRIFQFILAFLAETSVQKGILWWAANHRHHHKHSDTPQDPHSAKIYGFWYSHIGWIIGRDFNKTHYKIVGDFAKFAEIRWIDKNYMLPPLLMALIVMWLGGLVNGGSSTAMFTHGWSTLVVGFFLSTVFLFHGTFSINSLMHKIGNQRYQTGDESRNSLWLALITLGEGWHNNHHYYQSTVRQGFFWWEIDVTYYILKIMSWTGLIWDLKGVPSHIKHAHKSENSNS
jgi:stearoyl-CoA desaturase (Delta-9 desaturase)